MKVAKTTWLNVLTNMTETTVAELLRVANIVEESRMGGPQVRIAAVACVLKGSVNTTVVMPLEHSEVFRKVLDGCRTPYQTLALSRITKELSMALRYVFRSGWEIYTLTRYLRSERFDLVHVSGGAWQYKGVIAGRIAGCKVLWHLNDTSMPWLFRALFSMFSRFADGYIFASERTRNYYGALIPRGKAEFVIPAPVDIGRFDPDRHVAGDEDLLARWAGKIVIGTVGNVNRIKGFDLFLQVADSLNKRFDDLQFLVVGPIFDSQAQYYEKLQRMAVQYDLNNVEFVGARMDVRPLLKRMDIYVCASRTESSPISVWEAMAMAKPIVSTDVGDVAVHVKDGESGFIVPPGDVDALQQRIGRLISDAALRASLGRQARDAAVSNLGLDRCAAQHLEAYAKTMSRGSA